MIAIDLRRVALRRKIEASAYGHAELSRLTGGFVTPDQISHFRAGRANLSPERMDKIERALERREGKVE